MTGAGMMEPMGRQNPDPAARNEACGKRIRWNDEGGYRHGYIGERDPLRLVITGPAGDCDWWTLTAWIPGTPGSTSTTAGNPDELETVAEEWLEQFVSSLGAVFPG